MIATIKDQSMSEPFSGYESGYIDGHKAGVEDARARIRREEVEPLRKALEMLRKDTLVAYQTGRIPALSWVTAGNVLSDVRDAMRAADERGR